MGRVWELSTEMEGGRERVWEPPGSTEQSWAPFQQGFSQELMQPVAFSPHRLYLYFYAYIYIYINKNKGKAHELEKEQDRGYGSGEAEQGYSDTIIFQFLNCQEVYISTSMKNRVRE